MISTMRSERERESLPSLMWTLAISGVLGAGAAVAPVCASAQDSTQPAAQEGPAVDDDALTLDFNPQFRKDWVTVYEHTANSDGGQSFGEQNFPTTSFTNLVMRVHVMDVRDDGGATVKMTYDKVVMHGDAFFGGKYQYDSTKPLAVTAPDVGQALTLLRDAEIIAEVAPNGKVETLTGNQPAFDAMQEVAQLAGRAGEFSTEGLKQMLESFWIIGVPEESYALGQQWSESSESDWAGMGKMVITTGYDFIDADDDTATVNFTVDIALDVDLESQSQDQGLPIESVDLQCGDNHGHMVWDRDLNQLKERRSQLSYELIMVQQGLFEGQERMTNKQTQKVEASLKRLKSEKAGSDASAPAEEVVEQ